MDKNKIIPVEDVAKEMGTSPHKIAVAALNGTFSPAIVAPPEKPGEKLIIRIPRERYLKWKNGELR